MIQTRLFQLKTTDIRKIENLKYDLQCRRKKFVAKNSEEAVALLYGAIFICVIAKVMNVDWTDFNIFGLKLNPDEKLFNVFLNSVMMLSYASFSFHLYSEITNDKYSIIHRSSRQINDLLIDLSNAKYGNKIELRDALRELASEADLNENEIDYLISALFEKMTNLKNTQLTEGTHFNLKSSFGVFLIKFVVPTIAYLFSVIA